jgi:PPM family protein phosphatase
MTYKVALEFAVLTDVGQVRAHNEDSVSVSQEHGLAILADGMGGYNAGEIASGIATLVLQEVLERELQAARAESRLLKGKRLQELMSEAIAYTNASIIEAARLDPRYSGMGTTLVAALFYGDKVTVAHVGDSRAYRLRRGDITQITRDHSLLQEQIDAGLISEAGAQFAQNKNLITRAMGVDHEVDAEIHEHQIESGDVYLLCSDGLCDMLSTAEIQRTLIGAPSLTEACNLLVDKANASGGRDNISVVLVRVCGDVGVGNGFMDKLFGWLKPRKATAPNTVHSIPLDP